jgi:hypothetical protein
VGGGSISQESAGVHAKLLTRVSNHDCFIKSRSLEVAGWFKLGWMTRWSSVDWLVGWFVSYLMNWLVGWLVG